MSELRQQLSSNSAIIDALLDAHAELEEKLKTLHQYTSRLETQLETQFRTQFGNLQRYTEHIESQSDREQTSLRQALVSLELAVTQIKQQSTNLPTELASLPQRPTYSSLASPPPPPALPGPPLDRTATAGDLFTESYHLQPNGLSDRTLLISSMNMDQDTYHSIVWQVTRNDPADPYGLPALSREDLTPSNLQAAGILSGSFFTLEFQCTTIDFQTFDPSAKHIHTKKMTIAETTDSEKTTFTQDYATVTPRLLPPGTPYGSVTTSARPN